MKAGLGGMGRRGWLAGMGLVLGSCVVDLAGGEFSAPVVISEIHYHPVEEPEFEADGTPKLDLSEDVHEFIEVHNPGASAVDIGGWALEGGIGYRFPAGTTVPAGGYRVIARDPSRLAAVHGLSATGVLGPYDGVLSNSGETVRLADGSGLTVDSVAYGTEFPWPSSPDGMGDQDRFTGLVSTEHQYRGISLQRVSATWTSGDPANWLASAPGGATPGGAQAVIRAVPKPVVLGQTWVAADGSGRVVRPGVGATVSCTYSGMESLTEVTLEWFVDDVNAYTETRNRVLMTAEGVGRYTATIPGQASRSIVRYRFLANRGDGIELVSPRADDLPISPVGAGGALESWHGYFVTPVRSSANEAVYDVLVSSAGLTAMARNISQSPSRVTAASATGIPRAFPLVAETAPQWNGTVPGVFATEGEVWDIHIRYHGSRYHRSASNLSYKLHFPKKHLFNGQSSWFETLHGAEFVEAQKLNRLVGLPTSRMRFVDWYFNSSANSVHSEQGEYADEMLDEYHRIQSRMNPGTEVEANGELYKVVGNRDASQNNIEGPYTRGDSAPMLANAGWSQLQRYEWTFSMQNHAWKGSKPIRDLIEGMWVARGDTPATHNFSTDAAKLARTKAWFTNNWDVETTLTSMALLEWMSIWDDAAQNHFFWRRVDGRWSRLGWDYDNVMSTSTTGGGPGGPGGGGGGLGGSATQTIWGGEYGAVNVFDGVNWWKDTFYKCFREEYQRRLWELNNSVLDPANLTALGFSRAVTFANSRKAYVNGQITAFGTYNKPDRPVNAFPANGGSIGVPANLTTSAYSHPTGVAHAATLWELRSQSGDYEDPVLRVRSTEGLTAYPIPVKKMELGATYFWRATHLDADGHPSVITAETSFTWGAAAVSGETVQLGEVLALNHRAVVNGTGYPDYVELHNTGTVAVSLSGYSLSDSLLVPEKYVLPSDAVIPAGGRRVIWCDSDVEAPGLHAGFSIDSDGDELLLYKGGVLVDSVQFGPQGADVALGRTGGLGSAWAAIVPSPGSENVAAVLGSAADLRINEWMANPAYGPDWFEIHNTGGAVVALGGLHLSDTVSEPTLTRLGALSFIAPGGHVRILADGDDSGGNHADFKLATAGDTLLLVAADGRTVLDSVTFGVQASDVSQGRLPDGGGTIRSFTGQTASPGRPNWVAGPVEIEEVLANATLPLEDAIELHNPTSASVDVGGWWLSDDTQQVRKLALPVGTVIPAGGYLVVHESEMGGAAVPFSLDARGGEVILSEVTVGGALTGRGARVRFGASPSNVSFGRLTATGLGPESGGSEFALLAATSLGQDAATTLAQFRTGNGGVNGAAYLSPVLITEVHYHPADGTGGVDDAAGEFVEVTNVSGVAQEMSGWRLRGDAEQLFAVGTVLSAGESLLLVTFDPADNTAAVAFRTRYGLGAGVRLVGPLSGRLPNSTANLELAVPVSIDGQRAYVQVDKVEYRDLTPWPEAADGTGQSLQRVSAEVIGNTASNWVAAAPTPGVDASAKAPLLEVVSAADGRCILRLVEGGPGTYRIETSLNLVDWELRVTVPVVTLPFEWTDGVATASARFYRVRREP